MVTGVAAALLYALGTYQWLYLASAVFVLSVLLDRADGILARTTGQTSEFGHQYDLFSDTFCNGLLFVGIGFGLKDGQFGYWSIVMGLLAGFSVASILWLVMRAEDQEGSRAAELNGVAGFDPDDAILLVPLAMVLGGETLLIMAASIGAPLFAVCFFLYHRKYLQRK